MGQMIRDVMTCNPVKLSLDATVKDAATAMRDHNIGSVLVTGDDGALFGILTDRDIAVRSVAEGRDPTSTTLREICSHALTHLTPEDEVDNAIRLMAKKGIRRIPIIEGDKAIGVISLGDLAVARDPDSVLGSISAKSPNQ